LLANDNCTRQWLWHTMAAPTRMFQLLNSCHVKSHCLLTIFHHTSSRLLNSLIISLKYFIFGKQPEAKHPLHFSFLSHWFTPGATVSKVPVLLPFSQQHVFFMLNLFFCHEDGNCRFLLNGSNDPYSYTVSYVRRQHSSTNLRDSFRVPSVSTFVPFCSVLGKLTSTIWYF
jgi:hypothetical protein